jgi:hypothetical protein
MDHYQSRNNIAEERHFRVGMTGASTSTPTTRAGHGVTLARQNTGIVRISFNDNPGTFVGIFGPTFRADTPSGVKGYSFSAGAYVAPSGSTKGYIDVYFWDASNNAVDLTSVQYIDLTVTFSAKKTLT